MYVVCERVCVCECVCERVCVWERVCDGLKCRERAHMTCDTHTSCTHTRVLKGFVVIAAHQIVTCALNYSIRVEKWR